MALEPVDIMVVIKYNMKSDEVRVYTNAKTEYIEEILSNWLPRDDEKVCC